VNRNRDAEAVYKTPPACATAASRLFQRNIFDRIVVTMEVTASAVFSVDAVASLRSLQSSGCTARGGSTTGASNKPALAPPVRDTGTSIPPALQARRISSAVPGPPSTQIATWHNCASSCRRSSMSSPAEITDPVKNLHDSMQRGFRWNTELPFPGSASQKPAQICSCTAALAPVSNITSGTEARRRPMAIHNSWESLWLKFTDPNMDTRSLPCGSDASRCSYSTLDIMWRYSSQIFLETGRGSAGLLVAVTLATTYGSNQPSALDP
jgi:hypothetical protein